MSSEPESIAIPLDQPVRSSETGPAPTSAPNAFAHVRDKIGRTFDPEKFALGDDGQPRFDTLGRFVNKRAGTKRPPPSFDDVKSAMRSIPADPDSAEGFAQEVEVVSEHPTAESIVGLIQTALMLIGEEEGILTPMEKQIVRRPLIRVLDKYEVGKDVLPAEVDLVLVLLGLFAARLQRPKTATKFMKFKSWFVNRFFNAKGRRLASELRAEVGNSVSPHQ